MHVCGTTPPSNRGNNVGMYWAIDMLIARVGALGIFPRCLSSWDGVFSQGAEIAWELCVASYSSIDSVWSKSQDYCFTSNYFRISEWCLRLTNSCGCVYSEIQEAN